MAATESEARREDTDPDGPAIGVDGTLADACGLGGKYGGSIAGDGPATVC